MQAIIDEAKRMGATHAVEISPRDVVTARWVRLKCRYGCPGYGRSLTCPPHSPAPEETAAILGEYRSAVLVHRRGDWPDCMDQMISLERFAFLRGYHKAFGFSCGPCRLCEECDTKKPCAHPDRVRPSMEACGIDVFETASRAGLPIDVATERSDIPDYYALLLVE